MNTKNNSQNTYWYRPYEGFESRQLQRLQADLGITAAAAEVIVSLSSQVVELQAAIRLLKIELTAQSATQQVRLARFQDTNFEAIWIELEV